jgi:hypothetical protein
MRTHRCLLATYSYSRIDACPRRIHCSVRVYRQDFQDLRRHSIGFADQQLSGLLATLKAIHNNKEMTRSELIALIKSDHVNFSEESICRSVELAALLWSGVDIESNDSIVRNRATQDTRIDWPKDQSLSAAISAQFSRVPRSLAKNTRCLMDP